MKYGSRWGACLIAAALSCTTGMADLARAESSKAAKTPGAAVCDRSQFRVIIDVGHSEEVPGALSARGVPEYQFNLRLATKIEQKLREAGFGKAVLLITPGKAIAGLVSRIQFASNTPSDLLLSVHHDSVPNKFLEKWMFEGKERAYCDRFSGHSLFVSAEAPEYRASLAFARAIGLELRARGLRYTPHYTEKFMGPRQRQLVDAEAGVYRFDNLAVLRFTNTPAVLLEAGSIINRAEELEMASPQRQELIAGAVVAAVERYCNANGNRRHEPRIRRAGAGPASAPAAAPILFPFLFGRAVEQ